MAAGGVSALIGLGRPGAALGAAVATVAVLVFFATGGLPVLVVGDQPSLAGAGFALLMVGYVLRLFVVFAVLVVSATTELVDARWAAGTLIGLSLVWILTQVALLGRSRVTLEL